MIAAENSKAKVKPEDAGKLLTGIAEVLGVENEMVAPAYEDPAEWIVKEGNLPANVDPSNSKLKDPEERSRMARVFERGLTEPTGFVLPVQRWNSQAAAGPRWRSEKWTTRRGKLFLVPGFSCWLSAAAGILAACSSIGISLYRPGRSVGRARSSAGFGSPTGSPCGAECAANRGFVHGG